MDRRAVAEAIIRTHDARPATGHRANICTCGAPIGLWGLDWATHVATLIVSAFDADDTGDAGSPDIS
jgi:hypothetical protein